MANHIKISSIEVISKGKKKLLTNNEIKVFCAERVKISVTETTVSHDNIDCRVVLNRMPEKCIQNALNGRIAKNVKSFSKVHIHTYI